MQKQASEDRNSEHVQELQRQWNRHKGDLRPRSLWIACIDPVMDRVIERIQNIGPALILRRHGNDTHEEGCLSHGAYAAIRYAVEQLDVREIMICGHSRCSAFLTEEDSTTSRATASRFARMTHRIGRLQELSRASQERVVRELADLEKQTFVANAMRFPRVEAHGLFYVAESGVFCRYDKAAKKFIPIYGFGEIGHAKPVKPARFTVQRSAWQ